MNSINSYLVNNNMPVSAPTNHFMPVAAGTRYIPELESREHRVYNHPQKESMDSQTQKLTTVNISTNNSNFVDYRFVPKVPINHQWLQNCSNSSNNMGAGNPNISVVVQQQHIKPDIEKEQKREKSNTISESDKNKPETYNCPDCQKPLCSSRSLKRHRTTCKHVPPSERTVAPQPQLTAVDPLPVIRTGSMPEDHQNPDAGIVKSQPPKSLSEMHAISMNSTLHRGSPLASTSGRALQPESFYERINTDTYSSPNYPHAFPYSQHFNPAKQFSAQPQSISSPTYPAAPYQAPPFAATNVSHLCHNTHPQESPNYAPTMNNFYYHRTILPSEIDHPRTHQIEDSSANNTTILPPSNYNSSIQIQRQPIRQFIVQNNNANNNNQQNPGRNILLKQPIRSTPEISGTTATLPIVKKEYFEPQQFSNSSCMQEPRPSADNEPGLENSNNKKTKSKPGRSSTKPTDQTKNVYQYLCPECDKAYSCRKNVKKHRTRIHTIPSTDEFNAQIKRVPKIDEGKEPPKCVESNDKVATKKLSTNPPTSSSKKRPNRAQDLPALIKRKSDPHISTELAKRQMLNPLCTQKSNTSSPLVDPNMRNFSSFGQMECSSNVPLSAPPVLYTTHVQSVPYSHEHNLPVQPGNNRSLQAIDSKQYAGTYQAYTPQQLNAFYHPEIQLPQHQQDRCIASNQSNLAGFRQQRGIVYTDYMNDSARNSLQQHRICGNSSSHNSPYFVQQNANCDRQLEPYYETVPSISNHQDFQNMNIHKNTNNFVNDADYYKNQFFSDIEQIKSNMDRPFMNRSKDDDDEMAKIAADLKRTAESNQHFQNFQFANYQQIEMGHRECVASYKFSASSYNEKGFEQPRKPVERAEADTTFWEEEGSTLKNNEISALPSTDQMPNHPSRQLVGLSRQANSLIVSHLGDSPTFAPQKIISPEIIQQQQSIRTESNAFPHERNLAIMSSNTQCTPHNYQHCSIGQQLIVDDKALILSEGTNLAQAKEGVKKSSPSANGRNTGGGIFPCKNCDRTLSTEYSLKRHQQVCGKIQEKKGRKSTKRSSPKYKEQAAGRADDPDPDSTTVHQIKEEPIDVDLEKCSRPVGPLESGCGRLGLPEPLPSTVVYVSTE